MGMDEREPSCCVMFYASCVLRHVIVFMQNVMQKKPMGEYKGAKWKWKKYNKNKENENLKGKLFKLIYEFDKRNVESICKI